MHPIIHPRVAQAQTADLHRQAERDRMARAALAREAHDRHPAPTHLATLLARRLLVVLAAHSPPAGSAHDRRPAPIEGGTP